MSTDAFSPVLFPRLDGREGGEEHARARMRGYADGHAEGFRVGRAEAEVAQRTAEEARTAREAAAARELENAVAALHAAVRSLGDRERELTAAAHDQVVRCAIELAELIVVGELSDAGASAAVAARRALSGADPAEVREVRLHPDDLRTLRESAGDLAGIALVADDALDRGDAVAVLAHGRIDARVAGALERARHAVAEAGV
ncbi:FliH/SctL family protein [Microbacterium maritypicum]|uniref:FliH/SctL family protein n=1 Tax=Microbacterium maritypicum TaxID=33918 RepID=A0ACD4B8P1_MICMQ|nr:FliH/SctL family protein [Microbacterium liquefaciens]UTT53961.1 FliH/SctL family protein [Microbacterium liquefaciens]